MFRNTITLLSLVIFMFIFSCSDSSTEPKDSGDTVTDIDGNVYQTVKIGDQVWMAENLKTEHYRNGDAIPNIAGNSQWVALTTAAMCSYENDDSHIAVYGLLYNWYAISDSRNIAPKGWHVSTEEDWQTLIAYFGNDQNPSAKLMESGTDHWTAPNASATNETGFTALPGGYREYSAGAFYNMGTYALFWTSTEVSDSHANMHYMISAGSQLAPVQYSKNYAMSVRCVKD